jgi:uncharacterized protein (DUF305 family)
MNMFARSGAAALTAALTLALAACGGTTDTSTAASSSAAATTTSAAGGSTTSTPGAMMSGTGSAMMPAGPSAADAQHNAADLAFAQQMIVHHQGAIEMADLVPSRADSQQVKDLAARIKAAQGPEIDQMQGWLITWAAAMPSSSGTSSSEDTSGMDHGMSGMGKEGEMTSGGVTTAMSMPGMMSDADMQQLTAASGTEFDRLFLQQMIVHHQGALEMADTELAQGSSAAALALAQSIKTSQTAEITEMQQMLQTL